MSRFKEEIIMEEKDDKHPVINNKISETKYPNGSNLLKKQADQQDENKTSKDKTVMDENLTALYWG
jgi:hypothetical protein